MAKVETCDVFLPEFGLELGLALQNGQWIVVLTAQRKARRPRDSQPTAAFVRSAPYAARTRPARARSRANGRTSKASHVPHV